MTPEDLARIHKRAMEVPAPWSAQVFAGFRDAKGSILATSQNGFALGRVTLDEAEILTLAVNPSAQRQGEGRKCLSAFEDIAQKQGATRIFLEVAATNTAAVSLYTSAGFKQVGRRESYYQSASKYPIDALVMKKTL